MMARKAKLGTGSRFRSLTKKLASRKGKRKVKNPRALAAWIGRRKYGKKRFQSMAARGRKHRGR